MYTTNTQTLGHNGAHQLPEYSEPSVEYYFIFTSGDDCCILCEPHATYRNHILYLFDFLASKKSIYVTDHKRFI